MLKQRTQLIDDIQSDQYSFPYHYLVSPRGFPNFSKGWSFSASYIAAINLFVDWLKSEKKSEPIHLHMDYGCGDGGFIYHVKSLSKCSNIEFEGIDFNKNAIKWAEQFSQSENFIFGDIADLPSSKYDSGSLIEVYEHIPPTECRQFLENIAKTLKENAPLYITVPSTQKEVSAKHYRHFDFDILQREFGEYFIVEKIFGFERKSMFYKIINRLFVSKWWVVETKITNRIFISTLQSEHSDITGCGRIGLVVRKK